MKLGLLLIGVLLAGLVTISGCSKSDGGGDKGGTPAAGSPPPPQADLAAASYDNGGTAIIETDEHSIIRLAGFSIYNSDGFRHTDRHCDPNGRIFCSDSGQRIRAADLTLGTTYGYLTCINGNSPIQNILNFDFTRTCQREVQRIYKKGTKGSRANSEEINCLRKTFDQKYEMETRFIFNDKGELSFWARVNHHEYKAHGIGYKFNFVTKDLGIQEFTAHGTDPSNPYLAVSSLSAIRPQQNVNEPRRQKRHVQTNGLRAKLTDVVNLNDNGVEGVYDLGAGFRFSQALLFRFTQQVISSPIPYQDYTQNFPQNQGNGQINPQNPQTQYGQQYNQQYGQNLNQQNVQNGQYQNPVGSQNANDFKVTIIGGNVLLFPENLLNQIDDERRLGGSMNPQFGTINDFEDIP
jgi:hypothetical protein